MIKIGSLVRYIPSPSAQFKWQTYINEEARNPGIVICELDEKGITTRRFSVRWHNGKITNEWISHLEIVK